MEYNTTDLVNYAIAQDGVGVDAAFNSLLSQRLQSAVQQRKQEIASNMFSEPQQELNNSEESYEDDE